MRVRVSVCWRELQPREMHCQTNSPHQEAEGGGLPPIWLPSICLCLIPPPVPHLTLPTTPPSRRTNIAVPAVGGRMGCPGGGGEGRIGAGAGGGKGKTGPLGSQ